MPYKDKERRKAYNRSYGMRWYNKNKEKILERTKANVKKHREKWWKFKSTLKCGKCGFSHPAAIDFHHPEAKGDKKSVNTYLISSGSVRMRRLQSAKYCVQTVIAFYITKKKNRKSLISLDI